MTHLMRLGKGANPGIETVAIFCKVQINLLISSYFLSEQSAPFWAVLSTVLSTLGTWRLSVSRINASIERSGISTSSAVSTAHAADNRAFQATLIAEIDAIRLLSNGCETSQDLLYGDAATRPGHHIDGRDHL